MKDLEITWKEGEGWTREELVWTPEDTAFMMKTIRKNNKPLKLSYESIIKFHESLPY